MAGRNSGYPLPGRWLCPWRSGASVMRGGRRDAGNGGRVTVGCPRAPAGDLEDLGWGDDLSSDDPAPASGPDLAEIHRLRRELDARETRVKRSIADAQRSAETKRSPCFCRDSANSLACFQHCDARRHHGVRSAQRMGMDGGLGRRSVH